MFACRRNDVRFRGRIRVDEIDDAARAYKHGYWRIYKARKNPQRDASSSRKPNVMGQLLSADVAD